MADVKRRAVMTAAAGNIGTTLGVSGRKRIDTSRPWPICSRSPYQTPDQFNPGSWCCAMQGMAVIGGRHPRIQTEGQHNSVPQPLQGLTGISQLRRARRMEEL